MSEFGKDIVPTFAEKLIDDPSIVEGWNDDGSNENQRRRDILDDVRDWVDNVGDTAEDIVDQASDIFGDAWDDLTDWAKEVVSNVIATLDDVADGLVDDLARALGIPHFFAMHMQAVCMYDEEEDKENRTCSDAEIGCMFFFCILILLSSSKTNNRYWNCNS